MKLKESLDSVKRGVSHLRDKFSDTISPPGRVLKHFPTGVRLKKVDGIQCKSTDFINRRHYIGVEFEGHPVSQVPIEIIPMLVIGSSYCNKKRVSSSNAKKRQFKIKKILKNIKDESGTNWFVILGADGSQYYLRQLELARVLLLQNIHLSRTAFRANGLDGLAQVSQEKSITHIQFNRLSDYPVSNLRYKAARSHLAWLLLDRKARESFGSIYLNMTVSHGEPWCFEFEPPNIGEWLLTASIIEIENKGKFLVRELMQAHNPDFIHDNKILIHHPSYKEALLIDPNNGKRPVFDPSDKEPVLDLHGIPGLGKKIDKVNDSGFSFTFGHSLDPELNVEQQSSKVSSRVNQDKTPRKDQLGVGHTQKAGTAQELDYGINRSKEGDERVEGLAEAEPTAKFKLFKQVTDDLTKKEFYCFEAVKCYRLPRPTTGKLAALRTETGKAVLFYLASLSYRGKRFYIIEVDTESIKGDHTLSTLMVKFKTGAEKPLERIMQSCSNNGVRWEIEMIKRHANRYSLCKHPPKVKKRLGKSTGRTPEEYIQAWTRILHNKIIKLF